MDVGIQIMSDAGGQWMIPHWLRHMREHNPNMPVTLADYGCTWNAVKEFKGKGGTVTKCPEHIRRTQFETRSTVIKALQPYDITICCDLDVVIQGDLMPLVEQFIASGKSFAACADRFYPWCWRPSQSEKSNRFFPIMSGFLIVKRDSIVLKDWAEILKTWTTPPRVDGMHITMDGKKWHKFGSVTHIGGPNNAFRDDMQALSMIYRIGHPDVWEMPDKTQWFRLNGDDPKDYLVAHYTGAEGKARLKNERGWK